MKIHKRYIIRRILYCYTYVCTFTSVLCTGFLYIERPIHTRCPALKGELQGIPYDKPICVFRIGDMKYKSYQTSKCKNWFGPQKKDLPSHWISGSHFCPEMVPGVFNPARHSYEFTTPRPMILVERWNHLVDGQKSTREWSVCPSDGFSISRFEISSWISSGDVFVDHCTPQNWRNSWGPSAGVWTVKTVFFRDVLPNSRNFWGSHRYIDTYRPPARRVHNTTSNIHLS